MSAPIALPQYKFPAGYRKHPNPSRYLPFNGFVSANNPSASQFGATEELTVASVPSDLATMSIFGPNGRLYLFQFVYNGSVHAQGIKIPLPLSGASTAAQTLTAMLTVMAAVYGTTIAGLLVAFPWVAQQTAGNKLTLSWTIAGPVGSVAMPSGISEAVLNQPGYGTANLVPGKVGPLGAFLPGT